MRKQFSLYFISILLLISSCFDPVRDNPYDQKAGNFSGVKVIYDANGADSGTVPVDNTVYLYGEAVVVSDKAVSLTKSGYAFNGWVLRSDGYGIIYQAGNSFYIIDSTTLYAKWSPLYTADGVSFTMESVPGGLTFPTGTDDSGAATVADAYQIATTEVTYELWKKVYDWATSGTGGAAGEGLYSFENAGAMGGGSGVVVTKTNQHPVTGISWRDAMVWCNALTEWYNARSGSALVCVYRDGGVIRDSTDAATCDGVTQDATADGFRLPTSDEWKLAARFIGTIKPTNNNPAYINMVTGITTEYVAPNVNNGDSSLTPGYYWTPGDYASGASADYNSTASGLVAWYDVNSGDSTHAVKSRRSNALGLYDMSGNVIELCFTEIGSYRVGLGGSRDNSADGLQVSRCYIYSPDNCDDGIGFRFARTQ